VRLLPGVQIRDSPVVPDHHKGQDALTSGSPSDDIFTIALGEAGPFKFQEGLPHYSKIAVLRATME
jgi:hypothetical protein